MLFPKSPRYECPEWLIEQREHQCIFTGNPEVDIAHIRKGTHTGGKQKPHDWATLPLYWKLHRCEQHQHGELTFYQTMANEYPLVMMDMVLSYAKLRHLKWLVNRGEKETAIELIRKSKGI